MPQRKPKTPGARQGEGLKLSDQLCFATYAAAHAFTRVYKPLLDPLGLTYPQYLVMLVLWEQANITVNDMGEQLFLDSGTLTPLLKRLQAASLVERTRDTKDERQVRITLTQKGRDLHGPVKQVWDQVVCSVGLSPDRLEALKGEIHRLRETLDAGLADASTRQAA